MNDLLGIGVITERIKHFPAHAHPDYWEVLCCIEGRGEIVLDIARLPFERGTIVLIPPQCTHEELSPEGFRNYHLSMRNMDFPAYPTALSDTPTNSLEQLLGILYQEFHLRRPQGEMLCQHLLDTILDFLHALLPREGRNLPVERIKAILIHNLSNPEFELETALAPLGFSLGYLRRIFRRETEETPHEYLSRLRIAHARQLLAHDHSGSIGRIGVLCGFEDPYYFSRLFRQHTGLSPSQWRQGAAR